jgi:RNA recognition motif-containing protein
MSAHVYVEGLPTSATEEDLTTLFSECGTVLSVQIARTEDGSSIGIAEVQMARAEEAEQIIHDMHHVRLHGQLLLVC